MPGTDRIRLHVTVSGDLSEYRRAAESAVAAALADVGVPAELVEGPSATEVFTEATRPRPEAIEAIANLQRGFEDAYRAAAAALQQRVNEQLFERHFLNRPATAPGWREFFDSLTPDAEHWSPDPSAETEGCWRCEVADAIDTLGLCGDCKTDLADDTTGPADDISGRCIPGSLSCLNPDCPPGRLTSARQHLRHPR